MPPPNIASSFAALLAAFAPCFTEPSFQTFCHIAAGWVMCVTRRTVTGVILAADAVGLKHHTSFHRFFRAARWSTDDVGRAALQLVLKLVPPCAEVVVAVDDTLSRHTGKHISSAGMHRDPLLSTATKVAYHFGHVWVVLAVVVRIPEWDKNFALPVLLRLYRSKKTCKKLGIKHRKKTDLAAELIGLLHQAIPGRRFVVVGDNGYANREVLCRLPSKVTFVGRGVIDAAIYEPPPPRHKGQRGRPRVKGERVPSPAQRAADPRAKWSSVEVSVYGRQATVQILVFDALWHKAGKGCTLRFVVVRGWPGHDKDDVLICTDTRRNPEWIIETYCLRWPLEVSFFWAKGKLGLEDPQNRTERAVQRTAPMSLWFYSLVVVWYVRVGQRTRSARLPKLPWYVSKRTPAFSDMLATLRRETWSARVLDRADATRSTQKNVESLIRAVGYG